MATNKQWRLARKPLEGYPVAADFEFSELAIPEPGKGQLLSRTLYLSLDPYQWGRRRNGAEQPDEVCHGRTVSEVIQSRHAIFSEGDLIFNTNGWQEYGLTGEGVSIFNYMSPRKIDPQVAPISTALGVLGMLGLTAYAGCYIQCQPRSGETFVVSAASGGVGQIAGQIAKICGCRVVGIAGTAEKCDFLINSLGFDAAVCHSSDSFQHDLIEACPDGVDIYFENVGGKTFDAILSLFNKKARISLCGLVSQYGNVDGKNPHDVWRSAGQSTFDQKGMQIHSLFVGEYVVDYQQQFLAEMGSWVHDGLVKYKEDLWPGLDSAPAAFTAMLRGKNFGKTLVSVHADPSLTESILHKRAGGDVLA